MNLRLRFAQDASCQLARFIGADTSEVAFFQTTAAALSQAAMGIPLASGDEILTWDQEYPSNFYPWRMPAEKSGAKLIQVESENWLTPAQKILDRVTAKTKVIAVSWSQVALLKLRRWLYGGQKKSNARNDAD
ncbi:MAG: aminotransferase class V-fold PLP-dependent enzyme [Bdellovibrio sp.]